MRTGNKYIKDIISLLDYNYNQVDILGAIVKNMIKDVLIHFADDEDKIKIKLKHRDLHIGLYNSVKGGLYIFDYNIDNFDIEVCLRETKENAQVIKEKLDKFFGIEGEMACF